jgi:hypothetical protein
MNNADPYIGPAFKKIVKNYLLTASLSGAPALNLGCFDALIWIVSPVRGFRPVVAARCATENEPKPTMRTSPPDLSAPAILSKTASTARPASAFVRPEEVATDATRSFLFMIINPRYLGCVIDILSLQQLIKKASKNHLWGKKTKRHTAI